MSPSIMRLSETQLYVSSPPWTQAPPFIFSGQGWMTRPEGGDIDLLLLSAKVDVLAKLKILAELHERLGERKVDLAVYPDLTRPFARLAVERGVKL